MTTTGQKIQFMREVRGLSQNDLAELTMIHQSEISKIETGKKNLTDAMLKSFARALRVEPAHLLGEPLLAVQVYKNGLAYAPNGRDVSDGGYTLRAAHQDYIPRMAATEIDTGLTFDIPDGFTGVVSGCDGLHLPVGVVPLGIIPCGLTRSCKVKLVNLGQASWDVLPGDKIGKLFIIPTPAVNWQEHEKEETDA